MEFLSFLLPLLLLHSLEGFLVRERVLHNGLGLLELGGGTTEGISRGSFGVRHFVFTFFFFFSKMCRGMRFLGSFFFFFFFFFFKNFWGVGFFGFFFFFFFFFFLF